MTPNKYLPKLKLKNLFLQHFLPELVYNSFQVKFCIGIGILFTVLHTNTWFCCIMCWPQYLLSHSIVRYFCQNSLPTLAQSTSRSHSSYRSLFLNFLCCILFCWIFTNVEIWHFSHKHVPLLHWTSVSSSVKWGGIHLP